MVKYQRRYTMEQYVMQHGIKIIIMWSKVLQRCRRISMRVFTAYSRHAILILCIMMFHIVFDSSHIKIDIFLLIQETERCYIQMMLSN